MCLINREWRVCCGLVYSALQVAVFMRKEKMVKMFLKTSSVDMVVGCVCVCVCVCVCACACVCACVCMCVCW